MLIIAPIEMRLLVIEDEPDLLNGVVRALRRESYAIDTATEGEDGLFKALNIDYDCIILDVMLPKLDGWQILARLRESKATPVLMLTARDSTRDRVRGLDGGADDYLIKPFDLDELLARVRALVRRGKGRANPTLAIGEVRIDTIARNVTRSKEMVSLTAREYVVLEYLAVRRGEIVTRTDLYDHLFGDDDSTLSNVIDVHISNLRRKLGPEFITTRRGHGYVIE